MVSWRAVRQQDGLLCLLKSAQREPALRLRFEREVRLWSQLEPTVEWRAHESRLTVSRAWREQPPVLLGQPWELDQVLSLAVHLFQQLAQAHGLGLVHGAIHPHNCWSGPQPLSEFALHRGLIGYSAPEVLKGEVPAEVSDLYSAGVLLYQAASGVLPFLAESRPQLLTQQLETAPKPLRLRIPERPRALEEILQRLLQADPMARYQKADSVLRDFLELQAALQKGAEPDLLVGGSNPGGVCHEPGFVVRLEELAKIHSHREGVLLVCGTSGSGKSRLLQESARSSAQPAFQAGARTPRAPLQVLNDLARQMVEFAAVRPEEQAEWRRQLGAHQSILVSALPSLAALFDKQAADGRAAETDEFLLESLTVWMLAFPGTIYLDDMQWADSLTWELLKRCHQEYPQQCRLVVALRQPGSHDFAPILHLPRLTSAEVQRLATSMRGDALSSQACRQLAATSGGDLFLTVEMIRGFAETHGSGWQATQRTALVLGQRLESLPPATLDLLAHAALFGREFELASLEDWFGAESEVGSLLEPARQSQVIWLLPSGRSASFAHDRLREACLERFSSQVRARLHAHIASALEAANPSNVHALSYHFGRSHLPERAFPYALRAAQESAARFAYDLSEDHFRLALVSIDQQLPAQRLWVWSGLAEVLLKRGDYAESEQFFQKALSEKPLSPLEEAALWARLGYLELSRGRLPEAGLYSGRALEMLGQKLPTSPLQVAGGILRHAAGVLRNSLWRRPPQVCPEPNKLRQDLMIQFSFLQFFVGRPDLLLWGHLFSLAEGERYQESVALSSAYAMQSIILVTFALFPASERYGTRAIEMARRLQERRLEGRAYLHRGLGRLHSGRLAEAWDDYQQSRLLGGRAIPRWDENVAQQNEVHLLYLQGKMNQAARLAADLYQRGLSQGDRMARAAAARYWVRCTGGQLPTLDLTADGDLVAALYLHEVNGLRNYFQGRYLEAAEHLLQASRVAAPAMEKATTWAWLSTAQRRAHGASRAASLKTALRLSARYPLVRAHALRESAWDLARRGNPKAARRQLERSLVAAKRVGQPYEQALTLQARARMGEVFGWKERLEDEACSQQILYEIGAWWELPAAAQVGPALADRYQLLIEKGAPIAAALSQQDVYQRLREAAQVLLRAEKVELHRGDSPLPLVERALNLGEPVLWERSDQHESEVLAGVRSALACPMDSELCLYACHTGLTGLFGEDELRLVRFLVTLARAALDNSKLLEQALALQSEVSQREQYFRALFHGSALAMAVIDGQGGVCEENEAMETLRADRPLEVLLHPDEVQHFRERLSERAQTSWETRYLGPGGVSLWGQVTLSPIQDDLTILALSDVSYRKFRQIVVFAESERRLLASDLHDVITQPLCGLSLHLQAMEQNLRPELVEKSARACSLLLEKLSTLMTGLRTPPLSGSLLQSALQDLAWQSGRDGGYQVQLECCGSPEAVPELTSIFLYRILQESLQNVTRHARAQQVQIQLEASSAVVRGSIQDDGAGCDPETVTKSVRHGLRGMRERAELLGGWFRVSSPSGVRIEFELPGRHAL